MRMAEKRGPWKLPETTGEALNQIYERLDALREDLGAANERIAELEKREARVTRMLGEHLASHPRETKL